MKEINWYNPNIDPSQFDYIIGLQLWCQTKRPRVICLETYHEKKAKLTKNKAKAISAELLELNLKNKLE